MRDKLRKKLLTELRLKGGVMFRNGEEFYEGLRLLDGTGVRWRGEKVPSRVRIKERSDWETFAYGEIILYLEQVPDGSEILMYDIGKDELIEKFQRIHRVPLQVFDLRRCMPEVFTY